MSITIREQIVKDDELKKLWRFQLVCRQKHFHYVEKLRIIADILIVFTMSLRSPARQRSKILRGPLAAILFYVKPLYYFESMPLFLVFSINLILSSVGKSSGIVPPNSLMVCRTFLPTSKCV